jgi:hypothetical protein
MTPQRLHSRFEARLSIDQRRDLVWAVRQGKQSASEYVRRLIAEEVAKRREREALLSATYPGSLLHGFCVDPEFLDGEL